ncbi:MAG: ThiF family adenylyltransferase [Pseudomonadota bacterium]
MNTTSDIGHRHSLPASGLKPASEAKALLVRVIVPAENAASPALQLLASCLINLLARQVGSVREVQIACPATPTVVALPMPTVSSSLPEALCDLGTWATGGEIPVGPADKLAEADVCIYVGTAPVGATADAIVAVGHGWRAWVGAPEHAPSVDMSGEGGLGPFMAAALAAGEVFKRSRGLVRGRYFDRCGVSLWTMRDALDWADLEDGPPIVGTSLPPAELVGAGAVGQALLYALRSCQLADSQFAAIDNDKHDETNLNRCFLAGEEDVDERKVDAASRVSGGGLNVQSFFGDWNAFVRGPRPGIAPVIDRAVADLEYPLVLSCVDRGVSRHQIQSVWPTLILAGRTTNLVAFADVFRNAAGSACLACHNPAEKDGARIQELRAKLGAMSPDDLRTYLRDTGVEPEAIEAELRRPTCGSVGETQINEIATGRQPEFSVGFVSLAAGVMLAANLLRATCYTAASAPPAGMVSFSFLHGRFDHAELSIDHECGLNCTLARQL